MSQVFRIPLTKAHLDQIPHDERVFYLMAGQLSNDVNILTKLVWFAFNQHMTTDGVVKEAALSQTLLLIKLLAGKLYEGHSLIAKSFSGKKLYQKYKDYLNADGLDGLQRINRYFGNPDNVVKKIRHWFAFHFEEKEIDAIYDTFPPNGELPEYWGTEYAGYNLFFGAESITLRAMMNITGEADLTKALLKIFGETTEASIWFGKFVQNYTSLMLSIFVGMTQQDVDLRAPRITLANEPKIDQVPLPYFCLPPEKAP
jgi:hypothetical protein